MKISIDGNIGCGKSSILSRVCQEMRLPVFLEPVEEWREWLTVFYKDPVRWGMSFNLNVLLSFEKWKNNTFPALYERSPISNRYVFSSLQYDRGGMTELELKLFEQVYDKLAWNPDVIIYIRTDPHVSMERMKKRGRQCEDGVSLEYLTAIHNKYENLFTSGRKDSYKVITIDGNRPHDEVYADVIQCIRQYI